MKFTLLILVSIACFGISTAQDANLCASLKLARARLELMLRSAPKIANLTLSQAAAKLNLSADIINQISQSPYKDKTLRQLIIDLGTPEGAKILQSEIMKSSLGTVTFKQIYDGIEKQFTGIKIPLSFRKFETYTLNDLAKCPIA